MVAINSIHHSDALSLIPSLPEESIDLILADPPYGDGQGFSYSRRNDTITGNVSPLLGLLAIERSLTVLKANRFCLFFLGQRHLPFIDAYLRTYSSAKLRGYIVWDKQIIGMGHGVRSRHELIAVLEKGKQQYTNLGIPSVISFRRSNYIHHPNEKPVELMKWLIHNFSAIDDVVFDPFAGCGTTCVAAKLSGRRFIGVEIEEQYVAIGRHRVNLTED
jgi:adenine-specific DNA-methyltransferase